MSIKVTIIDDHPLAIEGIRMMLSDEPDIAVVAGYTTFTDLKEGLRSSLPDVLLLDVLLPDAQGNEIAAFISKQYPTIRMIALSSLDAPPIVRSMMQTGCLGYLLKGTTRQTLIQAIQSVYRQQEFIEPSLKEYLLQNMLGLTKPGVTPFELTSREKEILQLIVDGYTTQEIAGKLSISPRTAETHRLTLLKKLKVKNTAGLVKNAIKLGLAE